MNAFLLKDIEFEDLLGVGKVLYKGSQVKVDTFDDTLLIISEGQLDYIVKVEREDYRRFQEMN